MRADTPAKIRFLRHRATSHAPRCAANTRDGRCNHGLTNKLLSFRVWNPGYDKPKAVTVRVCEKHFKRPPKRLFVEGVPCRAYPFISRDGT